MLEAAVAALARIKWHLDGHIFGQVFKAVVLFEAVAALRMAQVAQGRAKRFLR